jgi:hypothetical protein
VDDNLKSLKTDEQGNFITYPVTGWKTVLAAGTALLVAFEYIDREEQFESGERNLIQLVLSPAQCLHLAEQLTDFATRVVSPVVPGTSLN